jgi:hypothetical protein
MSLVPQFATPGALRTDAMVEVSVVSSLVHFPLNEARGFPRPAAET